MTTEHPIGDRPADEPEEERIDHPLRARFAQMAEQDLIEMQNQYLKAKEPTDKQEV